MIKHLGYPVYLLTLLGIWKILGVVALLIPKFPLLKEWAYAGFFFVMTRYLNLLTMSCNRLWAIFMP